MSSDFINGDRSPIHPDQSPQITEISLTSRLEEQLTENRISHVQSNQVFPEIRASVTPVSSQKKSWEQFLALEKQKSVQGRPSNGDRSNHLRVQSNHVKSTSAFSAKEKLGIASQLLGIPSQKLGVTSISGNSLNLEVPDLNSEINLQKCGNQLSLEDFPHISIGSLEQRKSGDTQVNNNGFNPQLQGSQGQNNEGSQHVNTQGGSGRQNGIQDQQHGMQMHNKGGGQNNISQEGLQVQNNGGNQEQDSQEHMQGPGKSFMDAVQRNGVQSRSWGQLFSIEKQKFALVKKVINKINDQFIFPEEVIQRGSNEWKQVVIGFFFDSWLGFKYVEGFLRRRWRLKGSMKITADKEMFFLRFSNEEDRKMVLEEGPIFMNGKVFLLREWSTNAEIEKRGCKTLPIWARFWDIPKFLWNIEGLSHLASCIGAPLFTDRNTMEMKRMGYARMCVEVNSSFDFPSKLNIKSGVLEFSVDVEYQWIPPKCRNCESFGHQFHNCKEPRRKDAEQERSEQIAGQGRTEDLNKLNESIVVEDKGVTAHKENEICIVEGDKNASQNVELNKVTVEDYITSEDENGCDIPTGIGITDRAENTSERKKGADNTLQKSVNGSPMQSIEKKSKETDEKQGDSSTDSHVKQGDNMVAQSEKNDTSAQKQVLEEVNKNKEVDWTENRGGGRRFMGRHEVVYSQKEMARTRSGMVPQSNNPYSYLDQKENDELMFQFMEEYDEDGCSEPGEEDIPMLDGVPNILKTYPAKKVTKVNLQGKKAIMSPKVSIKGRKNHRR